MSENKKKNTKPRAKKRWTRQDSAEFAEHLASRGLTIVSREQLDRLNGFVTQVTQGLNTADPENAGRKIAVVWQDHLALLNDIARVVLALGITQSEVDALISDGKGVPQELNDRLIKHRSVIEKIASHLAMKEKAAKDAVKYIDVSEAAETPVDASADDARERTI